MKSFQQFLQESITINGDFNGTINMGGSSQETPTESYFADVVWEGKIYRMEIEGPMPSKSALGEQLQAEYPGAVVHQIYPAAQGNINIKNTPRYSPERLKWSD